MGARADALSKSRTTAPLDLMTMDPSARCTPGVSQSYK
jgi:hypothetical protein